MNGKVNNGGDDEIDGDTKNPLISGCFTEMIVQQAMKLETRTNFCQSEAW